MGEANNHKAFARISACSTVITIMQLTSARSTAFSFLTSSSLRAKISTLLSSGGCSVVWVPASTLLMPSCREESGDRAPKLQTCR